RLGRHRQARRDTCDVQLVRGLLHEQLIAARLRRRLDESVWVVLQSFIGAVDADELIDAVVVWLHIAVRDRPVEAEPVDGLPAEIVRTESQRDATPVIRTAPEHPGPPPLERLRPLRHGERLAVDAPPAVTRIELAERTRLGR